MCDHQFIKNYYSYISLICVYHQNSITYHVSNKSQGIALTKFCETFYHRVARIAYRRNAFPMIFLILPFHTSNLAEHEQCEHERESTFPFKTNSIGLRRELNPLDIRLLFFREIDEIWIRASTMEKADAEKENSRQDSS